MPSEGDLRQPYGPGWEDPDWTPHASSAAEPGEVCAGGTSATLGQFMENLRRVAVARPAANAKRLGREARPAPAIGQTRRWVMASGASLLAAGTFALTRGTRPPADATRGDAGANVQARAATPAPEGDAPRSKG